MVTGEEVMVMSQYIPSFSQSARVSRMGNVFSSSPSLKELNETGSQQLSVHRCRLDKIDLALIAISVVLLIQTIIILTLLILVCRLRKKSPRRYSRIMSSSSNSYVDFRQGDNRISEENIYSTPSRVPMASFYASVD